MAPFIDREAKTIQFVTDDDSAKVDELIANPDLCLTFANDKKMLFASVSGRAEVSRDRSLIQRLWGPYCDVFFAGGPDDAEVVVITLDPERAEYWDNDTNILLMAGEVTKAYFTDDGPNLGENAKLDMTYGDVRS